MNGPALKIHAGFIGHSALQLLVWQVVAPAVLDEHGAGLDKAEGHIGMGSEYLFYSESSMQVSVEDEIRNHRLTDISHNVISGGHECEVRCKSLSFQYGHRLRGAAAPGREKNFHRLHRG